MKTAAQTQQRKANYEQRLRDRGFHHYSMRLSRPARQELDRLARVFACTPKDVVEGFLLGTIDREIVRLMRDHGLSEAEAREWIRVREEDTRWTLRAQA